MSIKDIFVYLLGFLCVLSSVGVISSKKSLNSALSLVVTMFLLAGEFALLRADFIAALQVLVYAGAIMILVVFVIMLLGVEKEAEKIKIGLPVFITLPFVVVFLCSILVSVTSFYEIYPVAQGDLRIFSPKEIGISLFGDHVISFQVVGMLLLAAVVGAAYLAQSKKRPMLEGRGLAAVRRKYGSEVK